LFQFEDAVAIEANEASPMIRRTLLVAALGLTLASLAAALLARPSGAAHRKYTIAYFGGGYIDHASIREEARRVGVRILFPDPRSPQDAVRIWNSLITRRVDAIIDAGFDPSMKPIYRKVRKAGILLISSGDDIAGKRDLWVSQSDRVAYGHALADALASQIGKKGEYAILDEQGEFPIAHAWKKVVENYIPKAYPNMKLDGAPTETGAGDASEGEAVKNFMAAHPNLKGLISITPTETYVAGEAITEAGRIGEIFSAGNGGTTPVDPQLAGYVRSGAAELVYASNTNKQGYLTVWAAHYLLTGHHFSRGAYEVGGPVGRVWYYPKHRELRLGQPLTVTKKNLDLYAKKF
jgi:rhamnose transport system substrate-binding protein